MTTRAQQREIIEYLFTVAGLTEDATTTLVETCRFSAVTALLAMNDEAIKNSLTTEGLGDVEMSAVTSIKRWIVEYAQTHNGELPDTLDAWRDQLDRAEMNRFIIAQTAATAIPTGPQAAQAAPQALANPDGAYATSNTARGTYLTLKLVDYPSFNGRQESWFTFRVKMEAACEAGGLHDVLGLAPTVDQDKLDEHLEKRSTDSAYNQCVMDVYAILKMKTASGIASSKVKHYNSMHDGAQAWLELYTFYHKVGDKNQFIYNVLSELMNLRFSNGTPGGIDHYISDHETCIERLENSELLLPSLVKKCLFLRGIEHDKFEATKEICAKDQETLQGTVLQVRRRATTLGLVEDKNPAFR